MKVDVSNPTKAEMYFVPGTIVSTSWFHCVQFESLITAGLATILAKLNVSYLREGGSSGIVSLLVMIKKLF